MSNVVELAARMLAAAYGTGSVLRCDTTEVAAREGTEVVGIAWRGKREESAARAIGGCTRAPQLHTWARAGKVALPAVRGDVLTVGAMAGVERVPAALLSVFALQDWQQWPLVERCALHVITGRGAREAVCDAMACILWRRATMAKQDRARELRMRSADYSGLVARADALLRRWLERGARQLVAQLKPERNAPANQH